MPPCHAWLSIARGQNEGKVVLCQDQMKVKKNQYSNNFIYLQGKAVLNLDSPKNTKNKQPNKQKKKDLVYAQTTLNFVCPSFSYVSSLIYLNGHR